MRIRATLIAALLTIGALAPAAAADVCYDLDVVLNGEAVIDESDCIEA